MAPTGARPSFCGAALRMTQDAVLASGDFELLQIEGHSGDPVDEALRLLRPFWVPAMERFWSSISSSDLRMLLDPGGLLQLDHELAHEVRAGGIRRAIKKGPAVQSSSVLSDLYHVASGVMSFSEARMYASSVDGLPHRLLTIAEASSLPDRVQGVSDWVWLGTIFGADLGKAWAFHVTTRALKVWSRQNRLNVMCRKL